MNPTLLIAAVFACLLFVLRNDAHAQFLPSGCPGQWVQGGGGTMCLCPDGTYANMVGNQIVCPPRAQAQPAVGAYCSNGGTCGVGYRCSWMPGKCVPEGKVDCGTYACEPGFKCSSARCIAQDAADCGGGRYCNAGYFCGFNGKCVPHGNSECGDHACRPGFTCGSNDVCMPEGTVDCGDGRYCTAGSRCEVGRCIGINAVDCGSYSCASGLKCGSERTCLHRDWVDCGGGKSCAPGQVCVNGGSECLTSAQIADRAATPTQPPNIEQRFKTNVDRVIKALRDIGDWIRDGAAKPFPSVPFDILVFFGSGVLLAALLLINVMPLSRREQVLTHEGPKHPETGRVPSEGPAAWSIAPVRPGATSASEPSSEHRDAWGVSEPSSGHDDSPSAVHSKAGTTKSPQVERDVALERDGGADKVRGEVPSVTIVGPDHEVTTTSSTIAFGRAKEASIDTPAARHAMKLAKSFIDEINDTPDETQWKEQRHTLMLAAKRLNIAAQADPDATLEDGNMTYTIPTLRALMLYKEARTWDKQDYSKAVQIAKKAVEADPDFVSAHHMLAVYHWDRREKNQALASVDRVLELDPDNIEALKLRDRILSLTTAEIAAYKTTDLAAATYNVGVRTFNITRLIIAIILLPLRILLWPMRIFARLFHDK